MITNIIERVRSAHPLIHCITNYVTAGEVANMILAIGGSPIMSDEPREVEDVVNICQALVLNLGTLSEKKLEAMVSAGRKANERGIPVVFDPVGAGSSAFRTQAAEYLMTEVKMTVIRGNASEINALAGRHIVSYGVDAGALEAVTEENMEKQAEFLKSLSASFQAVMVMTGRLDLVAEENEYAIIHNGHPWMTRITGAGCMLNGMIAAYVAAGGADSVFNAVTAAVASEGLCGELAYEAANTLGTGSFLVKLIDAASCLTDEIWREGVRIEIR